MTNHFDFLIEDASRAFFQEVAVDRAADLLSKTASATPTDFTEEVDAALATIERAGPVGVSLAMTKRAMAHVERLAGDPRLLAQPVLAPEIFGKLAAAAVAADMAAAADEMCKRAAPEDEIQVRRAVAEVGIGLATELERLRVGIDKRAAGLGIGGLGRAGVLAKELRGASNLARGYAGAAEEGLNRVGRKWRAGQALKARANVRQIGQELHGAGRPAIAARSAGAGRAVAGAQQRQLDEAQKAYAERRRAAVAKAPAGAVVGARNAGSPEGAAPSSSATGQSSTLDMFKKLHTQGWSALAPQEKTRLVAGGIGAIGAHRLVTGRDLLSGEKANE